VTKRAALRHGALKIKLACPTGTPGPCAGRVDLKRGRTSLGHVRFSIAAGKTNTLKLKLHLGHKAAPKRATLKASAHDAVGDSKVTTGKIKLK
jgi:hypothetical protein